MRLYTCVITHRHGTDIYNELDPKRLTERLYEYVVSNWDEILSVGEDREVPEDRSAAIEEYFDRHPTEYYEWPEEDLEHPQIEEIDNGFSLKFENPHGDGFLRVDAYTTDEGVVADIFPNDDNESVAGGWALWDEAESDDG